MLSYNKRTVLFLVFTILNSHLFHPAEQQKNNDVASLKKLVFKAAGDKKDNPSSIAPDNKAIGALGFFLAKYPETDLDQFEINEGQPLVQFLACSKLWSPLLYLLETHPHLKAARRDLHNHASYASTPLLSLCYLAQTDHLSTQNRRLMHEIVRIILKRSPETVLMARGDGLTPLKVCCSSFHDAELLQSIYNATMNRPGHIINFNDLLQHAAQAILLEEGVENPFHQILRNCQRIYQHSQPRQQPMYEYPSSVPPFINGQQPHTQAVALDPQYLDYFIKKLLAAGSTNKTGSAHNNNRNLAHETAINLVREFQQKYPNINLDTFKVLPGQTIPYVLATSNLWTTLEQLLKDNPSLTASQPSEQQDHPSFMSTTLLALCLQGQNANISEVYRKKIRNIVTIILQRAPECLNAARVDGLTPIQACLSSSTRYIDKKLFEIVYQHAMVYGPNSLDPELLVNYVIQTAKYQGCTLRHQESTMSTLYNLFDNCYQKFCNNQTLPADSAAASSDCPSLQNQSLQECPSIPERFQRFPLPAQPAAYHNESYFEEQATFGAYQPVDEDCFDEQATVSGYAPPTTFHNPQGQQPLCYNPDRLFPNNAVRSSNYPQLGTNNTSNSSQATANKRSHNPYIR